MDLTILDPSVMENTRTTSTEYDSVLNTIIKDTQFHNQVVQLGQFTKKNRAANERTKLAARYGRDATVLGFTFKTVKGDDHDLLVTRYDPTKVIEGAYETFKAEQAQRVTDSKAKRRDQEAEAKAKKDNEDRAARIRAAANQDELPL